MSEIIRHPESRSSSHFVEIKPKAKEAFERREEIRTKYKMESDLVVMKGRVLGKEVAEDSRVLAGYERNSLLDEMEFHATDGHMVRPREIAETNLREMARATALKWYITLSRLFNHEEFAKISTHQEGRIKIAIPGVYYGLEIGGILDFFNEQGIPVDIEAVDEKLAGRVEEYMLLDEKEKELNSTVSFHPNTDAREYFQGKENDIVVLRHPGPVFDLEGYNKWRGIVDVVLKTNPAVVILSTYNHPIEGDVADEFSDHTKEIVYEEEIFDRWIENNGFYSENNWLIDEDRLEYPQSIYMIAYDIDDRKKLRFTLPVDRSMVIYKRKDSPDSQS